jgi:16S rRNA (cytosine967-C5)-methyltransferase
MTISPARRIAFDVLRRVEAEGAYASDELHAQLTETVKREDAALATEIALGVLRWKRLLDFLLERELKKPVEKLDLEVLLALRLGLYQMRFLERVPARAAVNESVELVKRARKSSAAALVNAVLRRVAAHATRPIEEILPRDLAHAERLGILHSHPTWLVERWLERYGEERTVALLEANNRAPNLACAVQERGRREDAARSLEAAGLRVEPGRLLRDALIARGGNPASTDVYLAGWISIQDEASQIIPLLLGVEQGQRVLDLCAAPGGKTATLAIAAGPEALVVAADRHEHRLRAMRGQLERVRVHNARPVALDATQPLPFRAKFDRILVDAPCSGTGTLARNPEIRWRLKQEDLADLHGQQTALLRTALEQLAPAARLVYSTCSLEPEENEAVIEEATRGLSGARIVPASESTTRIAPSLAPGVSAESLFDERGFFRTFPPDHHADGFFAAIFQRANGRV